MCLCKENNWYRDLTETHCGKYPPSEHAPGCNEYKQKTFTVVEYDGTRCVIEPHELDDIVENCEDNLDYIITIIALTQDQFEKMPEFTGF